MGKWNCLIQIANLHTNISSSKKKYYITYLENNTCYMSLDFILLDGSGFLLVEIL